MSVDATQLPPAFSNFYSVSTQVSAALIGLLFVSVSVGAESIFGTTAPLRRRLNAYGTFTALVNAFFLSFTSILPNTNVGIVAVILGALSLQDTFVNLMLAARARGEQRGERGFALFRTALSAALYVGEVVLGALLLGRPYDLGLLNVLNGLIIGAYAFGLARAWALLGGTAGHRLLRFLREVIREAQDHPDNTRTPPEGRP